MTNRQYLSLWADDKCRSTHRHMHVCVRQIMTFLRSKAIMFLKSDDITSQDLVSSTTVHRLPSVCVGCLIDQRLRAAFASLPEFCKEPVKSAFDTFATRINMYVTPTAKAHQQSSYLLCSWCFRVDQTKYITIRQAVDVIEVGKGRE